MDSYAEYILIKRILEEKEKRGISMSEALNLPINELF